MATNKAPAKTATKGKTPAKGKAETKIEVGSNVKFLGYPEDTPDEDRMLVEGEVYPVCDIDDDGSIIVQFYNPDFDDSAEVTDDNPDVLEMPCFPDEVALTDEPNIFDKEEGAEQDGDVAEDAAEEAAEEVVEEKKAPAKGKTATKGKEAAKTEAKTSAKGKEAAKTEAKAPAKSKEATKAPAKSKAVPKAKEEAEGDGHELAVPKAKEEAEGDGHELAALENEDPEVIALIEGSADIIATAQELEQQSAISEYRLGGVLRRILKDKTYLEVENGSAYAESGGFKLFLMDYFNIDYRKAMYLIQIYEAFTLAQIEDPAEAVARIGWTKASKIAKPLLEEGANADDLIKLAEDNTVADLSTALMEQVEVGGTKQKGEIVSRLTLKFRFFEDEAATVNAKLAEIKEKYSLKDEGDALLYMCAQFEIGEVAEAEAPKQSAKPAGKTPARRATAKA